MSTLAQRSVVAREVKALFDAAAANIADSGNLACDAGCPGNGIVGASTALREWLPRPPFLVEPTNLVYRILSELK